MRKLWLTLFAIAITGVGCNTKGPTNPTAEDTKSGITDNAEAGRNQRQISSCDSVDLDQNQVDRAIEDAIREERELPETNADYDRIVERVGRKLGCDMTEPADFQNIRRQALATGTCQMLQPCGDPKLDYCGPGLGKAGKIDDIPLVAESLDKYCCRHDLCYKDNCVPNECIWTPQSETTGCDDILGQACGALTWTLRIFDKHRRFWEAHIGGDCEAVSARVMSKTKTVCKLITIARKTGIPFPNEVKRCDDAGGVGCDLKLQYSRPTQNIGGFLSPQFAQDGLANTYSEGTITILGTSTTTTWYSFSTFPNIQTSAPFLEVHGSVDFPNGSTGRVTIQASFNGGISWSPFGTWTTSSTINIGFGASNNQDVTLLQVRVTVELTTGTEATVQINEIFASSGY